MGATPAGSASDRDRQGVEVSAEDEAGVDHEANEIYTSAARGCSHFRLHQWQQGHCSDAMGQQQLLPLMEPEVAAALSCSG
jgi:hypothetical protein